MSVITGIAWGLTHKNGNITKFYLNYISIGHIIYEHWYPPQHKTWSQFVLALLCPRHHKHADATRLHIGERTVALGLHRSWRVQPWHQPGITDTHKLAMRPGLCLKQWTCDSTLLVIAFSQTNVMFSRSLNGSLVPISGVILAEWHRKSYVFHWAIASFYFSRSNWSTKVAWSLPRYKGYLPVYKHVHLCIAYTVKLVVKICAICKCPIRILNKLILYLYLLYIFIYTAYKMYISRS